MAARDQIKRTKILCCWQCIWSGWCVKKHVSWAVQVSGLPGECASSSCLWCNWDASDCEHHSAKPCLSLLEPLSHCCGMCQGTPLECCWGWTWSAVVLDHVSKALCHSWQAWAPWWKSRQSNYSLPSPPPGTETVAPPSIPAGLHSRGWEVLRTTAATSCFLQVMCVMFFTSNITSNQTAFSPELAEVWLCVGYLKLPTAGWKHPFHSYGHSYPGFSRENLSVSMEAWWVYARPQELYPSDYSIHYGTLNTFAK